MGFLNELGTFAGKVTGKVIGGSVRVVGELTNSQTIKEIGDGAERATAKTGELLGKVASGTVDVGVGLFQKDEHKVNQGFSELGDAVVTTAKGVGQGIGYVYENGKNVAVGIKDGNIAKALERLNEIFADETAILGLLEKKRVATTARVYQDKNHWYQQSYSVILKRFEETSDAPLYDCWIERLAWVYSWIPSIPAGGLDEVAMQKLSELERHFCRSKLEDIQLESYMGDAFPELQGETLFCSTSNIDPTPIKEFVILADKIIHVNGSWHKTLSTTTKLLHFTFPDLFPIYDSRISKLLFGGKTRGYKQYHAYLLALREFLRTSELANVIRREAENEGVTTVRLVEMILFIAAQDKSTNQ